MRTGTSGQIVNFGVPLLRQRWLIIAAAVLAVVVDCQLGANIRPKRAVFTIVIGLCLVAVLMLASFASSHGLQVFCLASSVMFMALNLCMLAVEVIRGPFDTIIDPWVSVELHGGVDLEPRRAVTLARTADNGLTPISQAEQARHASIQYNKRSHSQPSRPYNHVATDTDRPTGSLLAGDADADGTALVTPSDENADPLQHRIRRLDELTMAHAAAMGVLVLSSLYPTAYYGERWFGFTHRTAEALMMISDFAVILVRCALLFTVVYRDVLAVAVLAADSQKWKREAADARLKAIQQFTRYIFHEARVPLQAVTLAVDELGASLDDIRGRSRTIRHMAREHRSQRKDGSRARVCSTG